MNDSLVFCRFVSCLFAALVGAAHAMAHSASSCSTQDDARIEVAEDAIGGVVRDEEGAPLAGVAVGLRKTRVAVAPRRGRSGRPLFEGAYGFGPGDTLDEHLERVRRDWRPSLEEALAAAEEAWHATRGEMFATTTDTNGVFVFEGLTETGAYALDYSLAGYSFDWTGGAAAQRGQRLEVVARTLHRIEFDFVGEGGEVFDEVLVRVRHGGWSTSGVYWERAQPTLEFTSEPVTLMFAAGGRFMRGYEPLGEFTSEAIAIDPGDPALANEPLRVVLRRRVWLTVQLEDPWSAGGGSGERWLVAKKLADDEVFDAAAYAAILAAARPLHRLEHGRAMGSPAEVEASIRFARNGTNTPRVVFDDLERGRYVIAVCDEAATLLTWSEIALEQPGTLATLRPPQPVSTGRLVVKLANAHHNRLNARPRFVVDQRIDGTWSAVANDVLTPPSGEHWIGLSAVAPEASELRIGAIHETLGLVYEVIAPDVRELELVFPRSSTLELAVVDVHPSVLATNVSARLEYVGPQLDGFGRRERHSRHLVLDGNVRPSFGPDAKATIGGLAPGIWHVWIDYSIGGVRTMRVDGGEVLLESGATLAHTVAMPKLVDVVVETAAGYAGQPLALLALDGNRELARAFIDADGVARFGFVPVGPARLGFFDGPRVDMNTVTDVVVDGSRIEWRKQ